tara:strand:+ start:67 stop:369 length:303 start_codon:yes stop_codon:yes gene_type:complete
MKLQTKRSKMNCSICNNHQAHFLFCQEQFINTKGGDLVCERGMFYGLCQFCEDRCHEFILQWNNSKSPRDHITLLESIKEEFTCEDKAYAIITNMMEKGM